MKLSLSARIGEKFSAKREAAVPLTDLADIAVANGYHALCMRASLIGVHTPHTEVIEAAGLLRERGLAVSMVTGDFPIPENSDEGPLALRNIGPYLDLAETLGCDLLRVALRKAEDISWAQRAADQARERGIRLAHQCHNKSLFEQVDASIDVLRRIDRKNFGLTYEPGNLELCGEPYGRATIEKFAPHLFNVYLQNQRLHPAAKSVMVTWCRGNVPFDQIQVHEPDGIDFGEIMQSLVAIGYDGTVTIHDASLGKPREDAEKNARYLRTLAHFEPASRSVAS